MKGQIGIEHIIMLSMVLVIILPGLYLFYNNTKQTTEEFNGAKINRAGDEIITTMIKLKQLGSLTKETIFLDLPDNFINITILGNNTLVFNYQTSKGVSQAIFYSKIIISNPSYGKILTEIKPGRTKLSLQNYGNTVCITFLGGICAPSCGNHIVESNLGEVCDGPNINGLTCEDFGYAFGTLLCKSDCSGYEEELCVGCSFLGPYCIDQGFDSITLTSDYVDESIITNSVIYSSEGVNHTDPPAGTCGTAGAYLLNLGAIKISPSEAVPSGIYFVNTEAIRDIETPLGHIDNTLATNQDFSIQCEGEIHEFQDDNQPSENVFSECYINNPNPDIRIITYNLKKTSLRDVISFENFLLIYNCGTSCHNNYDSGFKCLSQNHHTSGGGLFPIFAESDFVKIKTADNLGGLEGGVIDWDRDNNSDGMKDIALGYEDVCTYDYFFDPDIGQNPSWEIDISSLLDPINPVGVYELYLNIIWNNDGKDASFEVDCGPGSKTIITKPSFIDDDTDFLKLETHKVFCEIDNSGEKIIISNPEGKPGRVEFERIKMRKACN